MGFMKLRRLAGSTIIVAALFAAACTPPATRTPSGGASKVQATKIIMLGPEGLLAFNATGKKVADWLSDLLDRAKVALAADRAHRDVFLYLVLYPDRQPDVRVAARPALSAPLRARLVRALREAPPTKTRYVLFALGYILKVNRGCSDPKRPFEPRLDSLHPSAQARFGAARLVQKQALLRRWARRGALPILGKILSGVDAKFRGVRRVGAMLTGLKHQGRYDVERLTIRSPAFWRASLEMVKGDMIIPTVRILLYVANGQLDRARQQLNLVRHYAKNATVADYLLKQLTNRLKVFFTEVRRRVRAGVALHDRNQFNRAIRVYQRLLAEYPHSAWARYEKYFSRHSRDMARAGSKAGLFHDWQTAKKAIYAEDPLYSTYVKASTGEEAYEALIRLETRELFKKKGRFFHDYVRLADIALDLGVYGEAAQMYLLLALYIKKSVYANRPLFAHFLYCLEKLGVTELKTVFQGNHAAAFAKIAAERRRLMESSPAYKAMCRKRAGAASSGGK